MQINLLSKKNFLVFLLFSLIFLFGIFSFKDYGISTDEQFHRENGSFYYNYAKSFLSGPNSLETKNSEKLIKENLNLGGAIFGTPSVQPVFFDIIAEFFIEKLNIKNSKDIYRTNEKLPMLQHMFKMSSKSGRIL